jgi:UDP-2,3-diacylglucosamine pyrophosphatase LpxH
MRGVGVKTDVAVPRGDCVECGCLVISTRPSVRHNVCPQCGFKCQGAYQRAMRSGGGTQERPQPQPQQSTQPSESIEQTVRRILSEQLSTLNLSPPAATDTHVSDQTAFADGATILISDSHIPLHDMRKFDAIGNFCETQPKGYLKRLVLAGDIFDGTNLSRYPKGARGEGHGGDFGDEMAMGRGQINALVRTIEGDCWLQSGNHELGRLHRHLAASTGIPAEPLEMEHLLRFYEYDERLVFHPNRKLTIGRGDLGTIDIIHGERYNKHTAATILADNLYRNIIQGHTHRPQTHWVRGRFGHVNGHLHDLARVGYTPNPEWVSGFTIFEHWDNGRLVNPYFVRIAENGSFSFNGKVYRP